MTRAARRPARRAVDASGLRPARRARAVPAVADERGQPARRDRGTGPAGGAAAPAGPRRPPRARGRGRAGRAADALARAAADLGATRGADAHGRRVPGHRWDPRRRRPVGREPLHRVRRARSRRRSARCSCGSSRPSDDGEPVRARVPRDEARARRVRTSGSSTCSPPPGWSAATRATSRSRTRPSRASGRGCAAGSRTTSRASASSVTWPVPPRAGTPWAAPTASSTAGVRLVGATEWADRHHGELTGDRAVVPRRVPEQRRPRAPVEGADQPAAAARAGGRGARCSSSRSSPESPRSSAARRSTPQQPVRRAGADRRLTPALGRGPDHDRTRPRRAARPAGGAARRLGGRTLRAVRRARADRRPRRGRPRGRRLPRRQPRRAHRRRDQRHSVPTIQGQTTFDAQDLTEDGRRADLARARPRRTRRTARASRRRGRRLGPVGHRSSTSPTRTPAHPRRADARGGGDLRRLRRRRLRRPGRPGLQRGRVTARSGRLA